MNKIKKILTKKRTGSYIFGPTETTWQVLYRCKGERCWGHVMGVCLDVDRVIERKRFLYAISYGKNRSRNWAGEQIVNAISTRGEK